MTRGHGGFAALNVTGNRAVALLLRSPLHPLVSGRIALITVTGRAPVGGFVEVEATASEATARCGDEVVAECRT